MAYYPRIHSRNSNSFFYKNCINTIIIIQKRNGRICFEKLKKLIEYCSPNLRVRREENKN